MKYYAMIEGRQYGPMNLEDMVREGVRPDTYVWCKGMPDWQPAEDVADICRYFRQRLAGELPIVRKSGADISEAVIIDPDIEQEELLNKLPPMARRFVRKSGVKLTKENFPDPPKPTSPTILPVLLILLSILMIVIGFLLR